MKISINVNYNDQNLTLQQSALRANVLKSNTLKTNGKIPTDAGLNVSNDAHGITTDKKKRMKTHKIM